MNKFVEICYDIQTFFRIRWETVCSMFYWGWALRKNRDYDHGYLLEIEVLKLKRMLYLFENHGHHSPECENYPPKMKSIRLAIRLGDRLLAGDYNQFSDLHHKKWGQVEYQFEPITGGEYEGMFRSAYYRNGAKIERSKDEINEMLEAYAIDDRIQERHLKTFYSILSKYSRYWWD